MVEQLQQLNANIQEKVHSNNNEQYTHELGLKNDAALKSLIKHTTTTLSEDKVFKIMFFGFHF